MSVRSVIPEIWHGRFLHNLNNEHVYVSLFNRDYEGEIQNAGDTVRIPGIGRVTEAAYNRYNDITFEQLDTTDQTLQITEDRAIGFSVDDADRIQAKPELMDPAMFEAAYAFAERADSFASETLRDNIVSANKLSAAVVSQQPGNDDPYEVLVNLSRVLDEANVPAMGRWVVLSPRYKAELLKDPRRVSFGTPGNVETYRKGDLGMEVAGLRIYQSNLVPAGVTDTDAQAIIAGHSMGATWAEQIPASSFEILRPEKRFEDAVKGRYLYGAKVTRPYVYSWVECTYV